MAKVGVSKLYKSFGGVSLALGGTDATPFI